MEEYRGNRNASGRMQDAHWILMMEGSKVLLLIFNLLVGVCRLISKLLPDKCIF